MAKLAVAHKSKPAKNIFFIELLETNASKWGLQILMQAANRTLTIFGDL